MISVLTKTDLNQIEKLIDRKLEEKLKKFLTKKEFEEKMNQLLTKDEFYDAFDKLMKELRNHCDERAAVMFRFTDHEDRITTLGKIHASDLPSSG
ncbi:MAG TPA: hypothetical protein VMW41_02680 [Candidatus Bathyarchaeia archaeon]|nr:hypothetical protein [Candidatus Bathyarchaeia archaeon]